MKKAPLYLITVFAVFTLTNPLYGQVEFKGTFKMVINATDKNGTSTDFNWSIESKKEGGRLSMQIMDDQIKKGVIKRVLFNPSDSTWLMLMGINKIKQGTKVHRAAMFRDSSEQSILKLIKSNQTKIISGYKCTKYKLKTEKYNSELWITNQYNCNIGIIYKLLRHCGMIESSSRKGNWYTAKYIKGMILEIRSVNNITNEAYSIILSNIHYGEINKTLFDYEGYRISIIPEGQNCGVQKEEN